MTAGKIRASRPFLNHTGPKHPFIGMQMFLREAQSHDNQHLAGEIIPRHMGIISPEQTANQSFAPNKPAKKKSKLIIKRKNPGEHRSRKQPFGKNRKPLHKRGHDIAVGGTSLHDDAANAFCQILRLKPGSLVLLNAHQRTPV